jgi:transcriptional antiterminator RfaH
MRSDGGRVNRGRPGAPSRRGIMKWYMLYTRHHHERAVHERLLTKGFQAYLPLTMVWRKSNRRPRKVTTPLFPRHVFVRCYLELYTHLALISISGVMRILEDAQGQLRVVPEEEMRLLRKLCDSELFLEPTGYQPQGQRVEVVQGHLRGISGVIRQEAKTTLLVPIHTLQTSVAVEIDRDHLLLCADGEESRLSPCPQGWPAT